MEHESRHLASDEELARRFQKGDTESFETLIQRYEKKAFCLATRYTRSNEDAEEVLQDVFTTVFRKIASFEGRSSFASWFYRITVNTGLMKLRKRRRERFALLDDPELGALALENTPHGDDPEENYSRREMMHKLITATDALPREYQSVFILRDVDGLTSKEVGRVLNISVPAVKSRLHRARLMLREIFEDKWGVPEDGSALL